MALTKEKAKELGSKSSRKGIPNKVSFEIKESLRVVISNEIEMIPTLLDQIEDPEKKLLLLIKLLPFVVPKQKEEVNGMDDVTISFLEPRTIINLGSGIDPDKEVKNE